MNIRYSPVMALAAAVRACVQQPGTVSQTADRVAAALRPFLSVPGLLHEHQRIGDPAGYRQHVLHVDPGGSFSIVALVWLPGQETPIHDHVAWCVSGVYQGMEGEWRFDLRENAYLVPGEHFTNGPGEVCGFAPPGDIHLVRNVCDTTAISIHVYGADIGRLGTSVRRVYEQPVVRTCP